MQRERARVAGGVLGQYGLGEHVAASAPGRAQAAEGRAEAVAAGGRRVVEAVDAHRDGAFRRPRRELGVVGGPGLACRGEQAAGVTGPGPLGVLLRDPRVHLQGPGPGLVRRADRDPELDGALGGQCEWRLQRQVLDPEAPGVVPGHQCQLHERRAGQDRGAVHDVVGEPGLRTLDQAAGQQPSAVAGQLHGGAEERVPDGGLTQFGRAAGGTWAGLRPVLLVLERVGRKVDAAAGGEHPGPLDREAGDVRAAQRGQQPRAPESSRCRVPVTSEPGASIVSRVSVIDVVSTGCADTSTNAR